MMEVMEVLDKAIRLLVHISTIVAMLISVYFARKNRWGEASTWMAFAAYLKID